MPAKRYEQLHQRPSDSIQTVLTMMLSFLRDIAPLHPYARSLANIETIIGQIYPVTRFARFVTLELTDKGRS
jgi:hypothetical protein